MAARKAHNLRDLFDSGAATNQNEKFAVDFIVSFAL